MKISAFRRILLGALCLLLVLSAVPPVRADGDTAGARAVILQAYEDLEAVEGLELTVELKEYNLTVEELVAIIDEVGLYGQCLQPWYLDSYTYLYYENSGTVRNLTLVKKDPAVYDYDLLDQKIAETLDAVVREGMSQWQIVLSLHDYLATNCAYDETYTYRGMYDVLVRGTAVCSGYAETFVYLLRQLGIGCRYVHSENMNHAWNQVQIDGNWYHLDCTWDDPTGDAQGRVLHDLFLHSDEMMADEEHDHYDWVAPFECTDTSLDSGRFWQDTDSAICFESADVCYFRVETGDNGFVIYRRDREGDLTAVATQKTGFVDIGPGPRYYYKTYGLSLVEGKLYFSDMQGVYRINTDGSGLETLYSHDCAANKNFILGSHVSGGKIHLTLADREGTQTSMELSLPDEGHTHSYAAETVAPSCTEMGYTQFTCSCGVSYQGQKQARQEHELGDGTVILEPSFGQPGLKSYTCAHCGYTETEEIAALTEQPSSPGGVEELLQNRNFRRILIIEGVILLVLIFRRRK